MTKKQQVANMVDLFTEYLTDAEAAHSRKDEPARQIVLERLTALTQACEAVGIDPNEIGKAAMAVVRAGRRQAAV